MEKTLIMIKPDGVKRGLIGDIVKRFEQKGFHLAEAKLVSLTEDQVKFHYDEHKEKPFFGELISYLTSGPCFAMVWEGENIITLSRLMIGKTKPQDALPGTIRGDFVFDKNENVIHGSDSVASAEREIKNIFA